MKKKYIKKPIKKYVREAPNEEWFWRNREMVKHLVPHIKTEEPESIKKRREKENATKDK